MPKRKGWNSFPTAWMAKFKIPTAMVRILIHQRTPNINHFFILREVVGRVIAACYSFLLSAQFILSRSEA